MGAPSLFRSSTAVVQLTVNQLVVGSIPASGASFMWGCSSPGRASDLHSEGSGFESCHLHQKSMRGSYSGNTLAFQANAESSILLPRSSLIRV